jgi:hypothetical protein
MGPRDSEEAALVVAIFTLCGEGHCELIIGLF